MVRCRVEIIFLSPNQHYMIVSDYVLIFVVLYRCHIIFLLCSFLRSISFPSNSFLDHGYQFLMVLRRWLLWEIYFLPYWSLRWCNFGISKRSWLIQYSILAIYVGQFVCRSAQYVRRILPISRLYRSTGLDCGWYLVPYLVLILISFIALFHFFTEKWVPLSVSILIGVPTSSR